MNPNSYLIPEWPAPSWIKAVSTTRIDGFSKAPFNDFNLAMHVNDEPERVLKNRNKLISELELKNPIQFLNQIHGTQVALLNTSCELEADAAYTDQAYQVCAVLTADCLPLLVCSQTHTEVAAIHAGWRGLLSGVIDQGIQAFKSPAKDLLVWLGPAIGPCHFEINEQIKLDYLAKNSQYQSAFHSHQGKLFADLYQLAKINLTRLGISQVYGGNYCSFCEPTLFYSHRRDRGHTGRQASLIWIAN